MSEICAQELRATFLGNHSSEATERHDNTARHYANEQRAATHQHGGHCTRYGLFAFEGVGVVGGVGRVVAG